MRAVQQTALQLFTERGYAVVTMAEIAAEAGVAVQTVYNYFGTKPGIVLYGGGDDLLLHSATEAIRSGESIAPALARALRATRENVDAFPAERVHWMFEEPEVRAEYLRAMDDLATTLADVAATRPTIPLSSAEAHPQSSAALATAYGALKHWYLEGLDPAGPVDLILHALDGGTAH